MEKPPVTLFDFPSAPLEPKIEPTHVVSEVQPVDLQRVVRVYLTSEDGYRNYCEGCDELVAVQESGSTMVPIRVFCKAEKCVK